MTIPFDPSVAEDFRTAVATLPASAKADVMDRNPNGTKKTVAYSVNDRIIFTAEFDSSGEQPIALRIGRAENGAPPAKEAARNQL